MLIQVHRANWVMNRCTQWAKVIWSRYPFTEPKPVHSGLSLLPAFVGFSKNQHSSFWEAPVDLVTLWVSKFLLKLFLQPRLCEPNTLGSHCRDYIQIPAWERVRHRLSWCKHGWLAAQPPALGLVWRRSSLSTLLCNHWIVTKLPSLFNV